MNQLKQRFKKLLDPQRHHLMLFKVITFFVLCLFLVSMMLFVWKNFQHIHDLKNQLTLQNKTIANQLTSATQLKQQMHALQDRLMQLQEEKNIEQSHRPTHTLTQGSILQGIYLIQVAQQYLTLKANPNLAIKALQLAQIQLKELTFPGITHLNETINKTIQEIQKSQVSNLGLLVKKLDQLSTNFTKIPIKVFSAQNPFSSQSFSTSQNDLHSPNQISISLQPPAEKPCTRTSSFYLNIWEHFKQNFSFILNKIMIIKKEPDLSTKIIPSRLYLLERAQLLFIQAQWSVFQQDTVQYQNTLNQCIQLLKDYFIQNESAKKTIHELENLKKISINPLFPDLNALLQQLTHIKQNIEQNELPLIEKNIQQKNASSEPPTSTGLNNNQQVVSS